MTDATITALQAAGRSLREAARVHKRSAQAHRRHAGELMAAYSALEEECRRLGIRLELDDRAQGGRVDARSNP